MLPPVVVSGVDLERLERVERQLALLWEQVQQGDQKHDQRHGDVLGLYSALKEQLHSQTDRESLGLWVASLLEQKLGVLRGDLEQESTQRAQVSTGGSVHEWQSSRQLFQFSHFFLCRSDSLQSAEQQKRHMEGHTTRLADLELLLKALAAKTEVQYSQQIQPTDNILLCKASS